MPAHYIAVALISLVWIIYGVTTAEIAKRAPVGAVVFGIFMGAFILVPTCQLISFLIGKY